VWGRKSTRAPSREGGVTYRVLRAAWRASLGAFFRRVDVDGLERVPISGPTLLVANHSNAFVDGLLVMTRVPRPVSLTAKSTLRKNPLLRPLIAGMRVVELHRAGDEGADTGRNVDALAECRRRLAEGGAVCIFPEGISHSDAGMRPFKTGAARVALDFVKENPGVPLAVVPVGLHYDAKERFRSAAGMVFGEPFDAAEWRARNPTAHPRALTDEIEARIRALTANYAEEREAMLVTRATELLEMAGAPAPAIHRDDPADVAARVRTIHRLQAGRAWLSAGRGAELAALEAGVDRFFRKLRHLGISVRELFLPMSPGRAAFFVVREVETLVVGAPLALWGALNHALPYGILRALVGKISTDRDHFASNAVFLALPVVPLCYLAQTAVVAALAGGWAAALYALSLPLGAAVALLYRDRAGGAWQRVRTFVLFLRRPRFQHTLAREAEAITGQIGRLAAEFESNA
jgi:1-acyl-sn-glycerol-3-phosphate acyltransferase